MDRRSRIDLQQNIFLTADDINDMVDIVAMMTFTDYGQWPMAMASTHSACWVI